MQKKMLRGAGDRAGLVQRSGPNGKRRGRNGGHGCGNGVEIRPVCINASRWDCTLEPVDEDKFAVRLGFRQVRGLANKDGAEIVAARADQPFESVDDLWRRADVPVAALVQLAEADAMNESLGLARREALWALKALRDEPLEFLRP
jgi:error-prone DNA polymerase